MRVEQWVLEFIRKIPRNYLGAVVLEFGNPGEITKVHRNDVWTKDLFYQRFKELGPLPIEGDDHGDESNVSHVANGKHE